MDGSTGSGRLLRFGSFALDVRSRELHRGDDRIRLQEQPFEILRLMLERPGDVITRDELRRRLWPTGTFVDFDHSLNAAVKRLRAALGDDADHPTFVETLPRRGYRFIAALETGNPTRADLTASAEATAVRRSFTRRREVGPDRTGRDVSAVALPSPSVRLAVLPFANLSDDSGQEYFSDGLTEEMIAQLGRLCRGRIGIIARHSSMVFKGTTQRVSEIGEALRVDYLLEGSVRREGDRVRVTARLVETEGETHLWADTYDRDLIDCLAVQADVATRIASSLAIELVSDKSKPLVPTPEPAAYQAYLKGRYYWNKPGDDGVEQALSYFGQALRIDPAFAAAHAGIARARILRAEYYGEHPRRALEAAQASAQRALELDPDHYRAYLALGEVRRMLNWDWRAAEEAYSRSIALNPSSESAHRGYAMMLAVLSRTAEAEREVDRAHEVDPLCLVVGTSAAWVRYVAGDCESAIERCLHIIDMDPGYVAVRRLLGAAYLQAGRRFDAIAAFESGLAQSRDNPLLIACLAHALGTTGDRASAADLVAEVLRPRDGRHLSAYHLALAQLGTGDHDATFAALDQACSERDPLIASVGVDPRFEALRSDERFEQLLLRMGIPGSSSKFQVPSREVSSK